MKRYIVLIIALISSIRLSAQEVAMADAMRENGKIYVVLGVVLIIFIGLIIYLISIDRKVSKLEKHYKVK